MNCAIFSQYNLKGWPEDIAERKQKKNFVTLKKRDLVQNLIGKNRERARSVTARRRQNVRRIHKSSLLRGDRLGSYSEGDRLGSWSEGPGSEETDWDHDRKVPDRRRLDHDLNSLLGGDRLGSFMIGRFLLRGARLGSGYAGYACKRDWILIYRILGRERAGIRIRMSLRRQR